MLQISMRLLSIEHSKTAYWTGFALHGLSVVALGLVLLLAPVTQAWSVVLFVAMGVLNWSLIEYVLHRFVLHRMPLFKTWHATHHARPHALICTPTIVSALLIGMLIFLPSIWLLNKWHAIALTFGVLLGYLAYAITHHGIHHWKPNNKWLRQRKHWHALHHRSTRTQACYGVTSNVWDHVFRTDDAHPRPRCVRHRTVRWP